MPAYAVQFGAAAYRELVALAPDLQRRILDAVGALETEARPPGVVKLAGSDGYWRLRVGEYRVIYSVYEQVLTVHVVRIGHRRDVYR